MGMIRLGGEMLDIVILLSCGICVGGVVYLFVGLRKINNDVKAIMRVLSTASPDLERRVLGSGTQVTVRDQWIDDEVFEEETA